MGCYVSTNHNYSLAISELVCIESYFNDKIFRHNSYGMNTAYFFSKTIHHDLSYLSINFVIQNHTKSELNKWFIENDIEIDSSQFLPIANKLSEVIVHHLIGDICQQNIDTFLHTLYDHDEYDVAREIDDLVLQFIQKIDVMFSKISLYNDIETIIYQCLTGY